MSRHDCCVRTAYLHGIEVKRVDVEVDLSSGIPGISIIGMPDVAVLEARSRVRCALKACGFKLPRQQVTVNLAPGSLKKSGTVFDLAIAVGILVATGQLPQNLLENTLFLGELGLAGDIKDIRGYLAFLYHAKEEGQILVGGQQVKKPTKNQFYICVGKHSFPLGSDDKVFSLAGRYADAAQRKRKWEDARYYYKILYDISPGSPFYASKLDELDSRLGFSPSFFGE